MKKLYCIALISLQLLSYNTSFSQETEIKAGISLATMRAVANGENVLDDQKQNPGFYAAIIRQFPMTENFLFKTGLSFVTKGLKVEESDNYSDGVTTYTYYSKMVANLNYLEAPILIQYTTPLSGDFDLFITAGSYLGVALSGKVKSEIDFNGDTEKFDEKVNFGSSDSDDLKRLDLGVSLGLGFEFSSFILETSYNFGLNNISNTPREDFKMSNRDLRVSLGYKFSKK